MTGPPCRAPVNHFSGRANRWAVAVDRFWFGNGRQNPARRAARTRCGGPTLERTEFSTAASDVLQDNADGEGYVTNGMLVTASSRRKERSWRTASGVHAGAKSSMKKRSNHASSIRSKALCVPKAHEGDCTHVIEIGCSRYPIGIQFPWRQPRFRPTRFIRQARGSRVHCRRTLRGLTDKTLEVRRLSRESLFLLNLLNIKKRRKYNDSRNLFFPHSRPLFFPLNEAGHAFYFPFKIAKDR